MFQDYSLIIAVVVFFIFVFASRSMLLTALKQLNDEDKAKLLTTRIFNGSQTRMLALFAGLAVYYIAILKFQQYMKEIFIGFMLVIIAARVFSFIKTRKKLIRENLPDDYIRAYMNSSMLYTLGILVFFFLLMKNLF